MKRRIAVISVYLLLGLVMNFVVAGALYLWGEQPLRGPFAAENWTFVPATERDRARWNRWAEDDWLPPPNEIGTQQFFGVRYFMMIVTNGALDELNDEDSDAAWTAASERHRRYTVSVIEHGWPFPVMRIDIARASRANPPITKWRVGGWHVGRYAIPNEPMIIGLVINTIIYAIALWLVITTPLAVRRHMRIRRGRCPRCAYPMGVSEVCTECGAVLPGAPRRIG